MSAALTGSRTPESAMKAAARETRVLLGGRGVGSRGVVGTLHRQKCVLRSGMLRFPSAKRPYGSNFWGTLLTLTKMPSFLIFREPCIKS
ncbi:hypothetical protein AFK68_09705 [Hydrocoleum sp. CS-953]|nr:hypothetical protein AFK68_09705 [Hydrocoleum sp. CS-953]